ARDALKHFQDSPDLRICLCLPPTRFQGFDIGIRTGLDAMIAESFAEALSRELRYAPAGFQVSTGVQIPAPRGLERVRSQCRTVAPADRSCDSARPVPYPLA